MELLFLFAREKYINVYFKSPFIIESECEICKNYHLMTNSCKVKGI